MEGQVHVDSRGARPAAVDPRERLLAGLPLTERRLPLAGVASAVLEGGAGPPIVLLHGPGEFAGKWRWIVPDLVRTHRVIAPDLPGHGASSALDRMDLDGVLAWLGGLIERTCPTPPVLVGHVLGGAIAARFAIRQGDRLSRLVLVDSLGLAPFRPRPRFALTMLAFLARPTAGSYARFMRQCSFDLDGLREQMGSEHWDAYAASSIDQARGPGGKVVGRMMREVGVPRIPAADLERIAVPTALVWGRHDRAIPLRIAEAASARYGWPLHVVEGCADDPPRDRPREFMDALRAVLAPAAEGGRATREHDV